MPDDLTRVERLFNAVVSLRGSDREHVLDELCRDDPGIRTEVESLLESDASRRSLVGAVLKPLETDDSSEVDREPRPDAPGSISPLRDISGSTIGPYKLLALIGEGGFGSVYEAEQERPVQRRVALKIIKLGMDTKQVTARFEAERQALAMMEHPNIARVLDAGSTGTGRPYFVMELVRGVPITEYCDTQQLSVRERLELFIPVCQALQHAHQKGLIHRDVKSSNVLVALEDDQPVPKMIDFGIAKAMGRQLTEKTPFTSQRQLIGTPEFMSPEQAGMAGLDIDTRSDIYSLGILLYELLTGTTPFAARLRGNTDLAEIQRIVREEKPPKPSSQLGALGEGATAIARHRRVEPITLRRTVKGELDWIVMRCLEKDRTRRYASASGLANDIGRFLRHEPVAARPPSAAYTVRKFVQRNRAASLVALAFLVLVTAFTVGTLRLANREYRAKEQALSALAANHIERGRLHGLLGNLDVAEQLIWREFLKAPDVLGTRWALWELYSRQPCRMSLVGHEGVIRAVGFSADQTLLATGGDDTTLRIWSADTGECVQLLEGHATPVTDLCFGPGERIATATVDGEIRVWNRSSGLCEQTVAAHEGRVHSLAYSPDGSLLASSGEDRKICFWDPDALRCQLELPGEPGASLAIGFSPDGSLLAAGGTDAKVRIWRLSRPAAGEDVGAELDRILTVPSGRVQSLAFSLDGSLLATGGGFWDRSIRIWKVETGEQQKVLFPSNGTVRSLEFTPDTGNLVSGGYWCVDIRDVLSGEGRATLGGPVVDLDLSADGETVVVGLGHSGGVRVWETRPGRCLELRNAHEGLAYTLDIDPAGQVAATGGRDGVVRVWDLATKREIRTLRDHPAQVSAVRFSRDGRWLVSASVDGTIFSWDAGTYDLRGRAVGYGSSGAPLAIRPDGQILVSGERDGSFTVREIPTLGPVSRLAAELDRDRVEPLWAAFSEDGKTLATVDRDTRIRLWDGDTLQPIAVIDRQGERSGPWTLAFSPDGSELAVGVWNKWIELWDLESMSMRKLEGHNGLVRCLAYDPQQGGRILASASDDGTIRLWDTHTTECLVTLDPEADDVYAVAFVPAGPSKGQLVSVHADGTIGYWDLHYYDRHIAGQLEYQTRRIRDAGHDGELQLERARQVLTDLLEQDPRSPRAHE